MYLTQYIPCPPSSMKIWCQMINNNFKNNLLSCLCLFINNSNHLLYRNNHRCNTSLCNNLIIIAFNKKEVLERNCMINLFKIRFIIIIKNHFYMNIKTRNKPHLLIMPVHLINIIENKLIFILINFC